MKRILACAIFLAVTGCASIVSGKEQALTFTTNPPGAECTLTREGRAIGVITTPGGLVVRRDGRPIFVTCRKPGYDEATDFIKAELPTATFFNLATLGAGWVVDWIAGADNEYREHTSLTLPRKVQ